MTQPAETVEILLSTYNGSSYLPALLESLARQNYRSARVDIRDDGSTDSTLALLREPSLPFPTSVTVGSNLGAAQSYFSLLRQVHPDSQFVAFCDQDDVWLDDKLAAAVTALRGYLQPALSCSAVAMVDANLRPIGIHRRCTRGPSFANALVENVATGCTIVMNRAAVDILKRCIPQHALMHDAWSYLVIAGCGTVIYDPHPRVLYRVHDKNAIGIETKALRVWLARSTRHIRGPVRPLTCQARELRENFADVLSTPAIATLDAFLEGGTRTPSRLRYSLFGAAHRQGRIDDMIYRTLFAIHRI